MICYTAQKIAVNCLFHPNATSDLPILCVSPQCYDILATFDTMFARQSGTGIEPKIFPKKFFLAFAWLFFALGSKGWLW